VGFREEIRDELLIRRLQQRQVVSRINVTDKEIENFFVNQAQQGGITSEYRLFHILIATPEAASPEVIASKKSQAETVLSANYKKGLIFKKWLCGFRMDNRL
jgi:peptidyl-prolyl cis-trans isomerase SurA